MLNIKDIQQFKTSSFGNVILVENIIPYNLNPFRDEILSLKSILYFVSRSKFGTSSTALLCRAKFLSTNFLSLAGQVKLTPMRFIGKFYELFIEMIKYCKKTASIFEYLEVTLLSNLNILVG